jgi:membrane associated rhomboid family serine protease
MGVLTALPIVSAGNACCCLWVISGGLVAAYVLQQRQPAPITQGDGALAGLLAGIIGAFVYLALSIPISLFMAPMERHFVQRLLENSPNMPPDFRDFLERFSSGDIRMTFAATAVRVVFGFAFWLVIGAIFSTLGGLLGAVFFSKPQPPQTIDVPPSTA